MAFTADKVRQGVQKDTGYSIDNSCRVTADAGAKLYRTFGTPTNQKKWTWSFWMKVSKTGGSWRGLGEAYNTNDWAALKPGGEMYWHAASGANFTTSMLFRDPSAWYHIIIAFDSTQGTASDRLNLYVNGVLITDFSSITYPSLNETNTWNSTARHSFLSIPSDPSSYNTFNGYGAEMYWIDGTAKNQYDFGEFDADYNHWKPIAYAGSYGNNGCYLDFSNSGSLGTDASSNTNNWTVNNLFATDQMLDSPTNNFATFNPLQHNGAGTFSEGNLKIVTPNYPFATGTFWVNSGKWYWEWLGIAGTYRSYCGICNKDRTPGGGNHHVANVQSWVGHLDGTTKNWTASSTSGNISAIAIGDILAAALDLDNGSIKWYKNGSLIHTDSTLPAGEEVAPMCMGTNDGTSGSGWSDEVYNFGQDSSFAGNKTAQGNADDNGYGDFYYTPPTGYLALCTQNLPDPAVVPSEHFNTVTWTGNGGTMNVTGVGFQPDLVWGKNRAVAWNNTLFDAVRGAGELLQSNLTNAESTNDTWGYVNSFDTDGFSLVTGASGIDQVNENLKAFVAWNWKAGGTGVSNTNGSITSTVSANADAGFSIVTWTGNGGVGTVGHGLNIAPKFVFYKARGTTSDWWTLTTAVDGSLDFLKLNTTDAKHNQLGVSLTSTTIPNWNFGTTTVAYCFHSVDGYSKVGSYTGNGSTDGTFVHCGFRPAYVMIKQNGNSGWMIYDSKRSETNQANEYLQAQVTNIEVSSATDNPIDFLSNGIKMRYNNSATNYSNGTFIFLAFAETPFKHTNAR